MTKLQEAPELIAEAQDQFGRTPDGLGPALGEKIFISYNWHDQPYAVWVAWHLERWGFKTVLQAWDFRPGSNFVLEMQEATRDADRTIAILSPHYLASQFTQPEWAAAFKKDPDGKKKTLIPVLVASCATDGLLSSIVYVDISGADEEKALSILFQALSPGRAKPKAAPAYPGQQTSAPPSPSYPGPGANRPPALIEDGVEFDEFPSCVFGLGASKAKAKFRISDEPSTVWVEFDQSAFGVTTRSQYAIKDYNPFEFQFPEAGEYPVDFDICAKEAKDLNGLITVTARSNRVLLRRTYRVSAFALRKDSMFAALARLVEPFLLQWKAILLGGAVTLAVVAGILIFLGLRGTIPLTIHAFSQPRSAAAHVSAVVPPPVVTAPPAVTPAPVPAATPATPAPKDAPKKQSGASPPKKPVHSGAVVAPPPAAPPTAPPVVPVAAVVKLPAAAENPPGPPKVVIPAPTFIPVRALPAQFKGLRLGQHFSGTMTAADGAPNKVWTATDLPDGLGMNSATGEISGSPKEGGEFIAHVTVGEGNSSSDQEVRISVSPVLTVFIHLPDTGPLPVINAIKGCLAKFFIVYEDKPAETSFWFTKSTADEVKVELWRKTPANQPHRAADVLWSNSFPAEVNGTFDTDKAMKQLCYGSLGLKKKFSSFASNLMEVSQ